MHTLFSRLNAGDVLFQERHTNSEESTHSQMINLPLAKQFDSNSILRLQSKAGSKGSQIHHTLDINNKLPLKPGCITVNPNAKFENAVQTNT